MKKLLAVLFCAACLLSSRAAWAAPLKVVASQTFYADLVRKIGGEHADVSAVASPKFNVHFVEPRPSDVRRTANADLFVFTGLDLELWVDPLLEAAGRSELFRGAERNLDLSLGVRLLKPPIGPLSRAGGDLHLFGNPHYLMDPRNAVIMAANIRDRLTALDPAHAADYTANYESFSSELERRVIEWRDICAHCEGREIIAYHDDIAYLADFLGLKAELFLEPKPGIPPSPKHLSVLEREAKARVITLITLPTYYPKSAADELAKRTGAGVTIILQSPGETAGTEDVFAFFDYNVKQISEALK